MIDRATIEKIMDAAQIVDVVSDFVALKRRGADYIACCPFHNEKTPSFSVSPRLGIYKCFGCGKAGNAVNFIMEHEQMTYVEALKYLGKKYGIEVREKEETAKDVEQRQHGESLLIVNEYARKFFTDSLLNTEEGKAVGLSYFKERGFSDETIKTFQLGYADRERKSFSSQAVKAGYKKEFLTETGLSITDLQSAEGEIHDRFCERVMFPIRGISGRTVAFGGRKLRSDKNIAKYVNSPESSIYIKNKTLYGLYEAKGAIAKEGNCYLVEGYTDVISFHQSGVINVVASCGTSLTQGQIHLIKRFSPKVTVLYDGDSAGIHASLRGIDLFLAEGLEVKVALFPDGEDPDSYARKHTPDELSKFLHDAEEDFISFKYRLLCKDIEKDPLKRAKLIGEVVASISVIPDPIVRSVYVDETAKNLQISPDILIQEIAKIRAKKRNDEYWRTRKEEKEEEEENSATGNETDNYTSPYMEEEKLVKSNSYCLEAERDIIYYLIKYGHCAMVNKSNFYIGAKPTANKTVAEYIKDELTSVDIIPKIEKFKSTIINISLGITDPVLKHIYNEYFTLHVTDAAEAEKHFVTEPDIKVNTAVINLFQAKYELRSDKIKRAGIEEINLLADIIPKIINTYKAKVMSKTVAETAPVLEAANKAGDIEKERLLLEVMRQLNIYKLKFAKATKFID